MEQEKNEWPMVLSWEKEMGDLRCKVTYWVTREAMWEAVSEHLHEGNPYDTAYEATRALLGTLECHLAGPMSEGDWEGLKDDLWEPMTTLAQEHVRVSELLYAIEDVLEEEEEEKERRERSPTMKKGK